MNANKDSQASARNIEAIAVGSDEVPKASSAERGIRTGRRPREKDLRASKQATLQGRWRMEATMGATTESLRETESQISIATGTEKSTGMDMGMGVAVGTSMTMCQSAGMTLQSSAEEMTKSTTAEVKRLQDEVADLIKLLNIEQNQKKSLTEELERSKLIQNQALQALDERFQDLVEVEQELEEKVHDSEKKEQCLKDLDANLQQHRKVITGLGEQLMTCRQNLASMEERVKIAESSLSGVQAELRQGQTVIFENKADIACLSTKCDAVEAELEKAERKLTSTSQELVACYRLSEEKARKITKLEALNQSLVSERQQLASEKQMLDAEVRKLTEDVEISKSAMMKMNASIENLERQIEKLKAAHKDELDRVYTAHEHETNELELRRAKSFAEFQRAADDEIKNALDEVKRYYLQKQEHILEQHEKDEKSLSERIKTLEKSVRGKEVEVARLERDLHTAKRQTSSDNSSLQCELERKTELPLKYKNKFEEVMASSAVAGISKAGTEGTPAEFHRLPDVVVIIIQTTDGSSWSQIQNAYLYLITRIAVYSPNTCVGVLENIGGGWPDSAVQPIQPQRISGTMRAYGGWPCFQIVSQHSPLEEALRMLEPFDVKQGSFYRSQRIILIRDKNSDAITEHDRSRDAVFERLQSTGIPVHCLIASGWQPRDVEVYLAANTGGKVFWLGESNTNSDIMWSPELIGYESTIGTTNGRESILLSNLVDKQDHGHEGEVLHNVAFLEEVVVICIHLYFSSSHPEVFRGIVAAIWFRNPATQIGIVTSGNDDGLGSIRKHLAISKIQARTGHILDNMTGQFSSGWYEDAMSSAQEMLSDYYSTHPRAHRRIILLDGLMDYYRDYDSVPLGWSLSEGIPVHCVVTETELAHSTHLFSSAHCLQLAEISVKTGGKWFYWQPSDSKAIFNSEELAGRQYQPSAYVHICRTPDWLKRTGPIGEAK